jgi:hypothetical protein
MTIRAELADGRVLEFPDGTDPLVIQATVKRIVQQGQPAQPVQDPRIQLQDLLIRQGQGEQGLQEQITALRGQVGIPDTDQDVSGFRPIEPEQPAAALGSFGRGFEQGLLDVGTGALSAGAKALGALGADTGEFQQELEVSRGIEQQRTEEITQDAPISGIVGQIAGEVAALPFPAARTIGGAAALGGVTGGLVAEGTGQDPLVGAAIGATLGGTLKKAENFIRGRQLSQKAANEQIKSLIEREVPDSRILGKELVEDIATGTTKVVNNRNLSRLVDAAENQGFSRPTLALVASANDATKTQMRKMAQIVRKGATNQAFRDQNRASDIVGDALMKRYNAVIRANRKAGKDISRVVDRELKGKIVDAAEVSNTFRDDLVNSLDVVFDGNQPIFDNSLINLSGESQRIVSDLLRRSENLSRVDGKNLHKLKRVIDTHINFGKKAEGGIDSIEPVLKKFRKSINDRLRLESRDYGKANDIFAETKTVLEPLERFSGRAVDLEKKGAEKVIGTLLRRELGNAQSRVPIINARKDLERVAAKFGAKFNDDLEKMNSLAMSIEMMFKDQARSSLRGQVGADAVELLGQSNLGKIRTLAGKAREFATKQDELTAVKALEQLLNKGL